MKHRYQSSVLVIAVGVVMVMASHPAHTDLGDPDDPATIGSWQLLPDLTEVMVVHAALLPTGKVLMFAGEVEQGFPHLSMVWDPITNEQTIQDPIEDDIFCAGHAHLADGRLLTFGGDGPIRTQTYVFDPWTETWTKLSDMENGRWYPTGVTLADGRVVVFSGLGDVGNPDEVEIWDPATEEWSTYPPASNYHLEIYPGMHLMPNGKIFYSGTRWNGRKGWGGANSAYFDPTMGTWQVLGPHVNGDRSEAISVLLPELEAGAEPWRVLVAGGWAGGASQQDTAEIINLAESNPQWVNITPMNFHRNNVNAAILPDGDIAMVSGISGWKWKPFDATLTTEHFDPVTETWEAMASMQVGAQYHSIGLLLPDGRVLKTGGHMGDMGGTNDIRDMEVYSPAYLFNGPRPMIDAAPAEIGWAQEFSITTPDAADVTLVSLVKLGQITHHTNPDQRFLSLNFKQVGEDRLTITSPAHGNIAPPGYYMLFILNDCGVPSESAMVRIGPHTKLTDFTILDGTLISGGMPELASSDDMYLETEAKVTGEALETHRLLMRIRAMTAVQNPDTINITLEGHITDIEAIVTLFLRNFQTGQFEQVGQFTNGFGVDTTNTVIVPNASRFVRPNGRIVLRVKKIVILPFTLNGFHSLEDLLEIRVR